MNVNFAAVYLKKRPKWREPKIYLNGGQNATCLLMLAAITSLVCVLTPVHLKKESYIPPSGSEEGICRLPRATHLQRAAREKVHLWYAHRWAGFKGEKPVAATIID